MTGEQRDSADGASADPSPSAEPAEHETRLGGLPLQDEGTRPTTKSSLSAAIQQNAAQTESSPRTALAGLDSTGSDLPTTNEAQAIPFPSNRKHRPSLDLANASPPFSSALLPTYSRRSSLSSSHSSEEHHHNGLLDLFHSSQHPSPRSSPSLAPLHHVASPPPGANYGMSPHALLRQAQLASLAPPELSLPGGAFNPSDVDAKWPSPNSSPSHSPLASPLGGPGSPPLAPLFASPGVPVPQAAHFLKDDKLKLTRFGSSYALDSSGESESDSGHGDDSPRSNDAPLLGPSASDDERGRTRRRRRRSHRSRGSKGSNSSGEFILNEDGLANQMDLDGRSTSPPHAARPRKPHLAMPERSGWELTDDDEDASDDSSDSDFLSGEEDDDELTHSRPSPPTTSRPSSGEHRRPSPLLMMDIEPELSNLPSAARSDVRMFDEKSEDATMALAQDESLSTLERIFILSKSEYKEHRSDVSRALPDWLEEVDICEAYEYVLPLLSGLASDDDEVKVGLAQGLDRIMYYFFSRCPLEDSDGEVEARSDEMDALTDLAQPMEMDEEEPRITFKHVASQSSVASAVVDPPHISVGAFTPILGLLLMEQHVEVSSWARTSVVRFLCRLHGKPIPSNLLDPNEKLDSSEARTPGATTHSHTPYTITASARAELEEQILVDVVLGLARLEVEDDGANDSLETVDTPASQHVDEPAWGTESPQKRFAADNGSPDTSNSPDWGMPLRPYATHTSSYAGSTPVSSGRYFAHHMFDSDNEAAQGKMASIELMSAIAAAECLPSDTLVDVFLPEIDKMTRDKAYRVRSVAASALGSLAKTLPTELVESVLVPLCEAFCNDSQPMVRRWACLTLPDIIQQLTPTARHQKTISIVRHFAQDQSKDVRSALTEICGPLIHSFLNEDIPVPLLDWYLGRPMAQNDTTPSAQTPAKKFGPLATALSLKNNTGDPFANGFELPPDNGTERNMIGAFNLPAVVLTLGKSRWRDIKQFHAALSRDPHAGVRRSLAASLHAIADIIGAEQAAADLADTFSRFLVDSAEVRECVIEHYADFIRILPTHIQGQQLRAVHRSLYQVEHPCPWRLREQAASQLSMMIETTNISSEDLSREPFFELLIDFLRDETAAVRTAGLSNVTAIWNALSARELRAPFIAKILEPLFAQSSSYRQRTTFVRCITKIINSDSIEPGDFERLFLPPLQLLAPDPVVDVRLALARLLNQHVSSASFRSPPDSVLVEVYRALKNDSSSVVREALGAKLDHHLVPVNPALSGTVSPPDSQRSTSSSYANEEDDELMSDSALSSSTITDLRSLGSTDAIDLLQEDLRDGSTSPLPIFESFHVGAEFPLSTSAFSRGRKHLQTDEREGFVDVSVVD